jgi:hypothetical protein
MGIGTGALVAGMFGMNVRYTLELNPIRSNATNMAFKVD